MSEKQYLPIVTRDLSQRVAVRSILYLRQETRYIRIVTTSGEVHFRGHVQEIAKQLTESTIRFVWGHSYILINMDRVVKMADACIYFDTGRTLMIGKNNYIALRKVFNNYLLSL